MLKPILKKQNGWKKLLWLPVLLPLLYATACQTAPSSRPTIQGYTKEEMTELRRELDLKCPVIKDKNGIEHSDPDCAMIDRVITDYKNLRDRLRGK